MRLETCDVSSCLFRPSCKSLWYLTSTVGHRAQATYGRHRERNGPTIGSTRNGQGEKKHACPARIDTGLVQFLCLRELRKSLLKYLATLARCPLPSSLFSFQTAPQLSTRQKGPNQRKEPARTKDCAAMQPMGQPQAGAAGLGPGSGEVVPSPLRAGADQAGVQCSAASECSGCCRCRSSHGSTECPRNTTALACRQSPML